MTKVELLETMQERNDAVKLCIENDRLIITTRDGRVIDTPIAWFPFLVNATAEQRADYTLEDHSIHWNQLGDGVTMATILLGRPGT